MAQDLTLRRGRRAQMLFVGLLVLISLGQSKTGGASGHSSEGIPGPDLASLSSSSGIAGSLEPIRGAPGDLWADIVLGKPSFSEMVPGEVTGARLFNPGGVLVDRSARPNRLYVYDGGNSRVLGLDHLGICEGGGKAGQECTVDSDCPGGTCQIQEGRHADLVLGQPGLDGYAACNGDGNYQHYPDRTPASASTECSMPENQMSPREGGSFANMAVDSQGNLYVPDFDNHRVLLYLSPFETDTVADDVWGQADFIGNECNRGRGVFEPDAESLCFRSPFNEGFVGGVGLDSDGSLWVADNQNNRVARFPYDPVRGWAGHDADLVLGQSDFASGHHGDALDQMWAPAAVRVDEAGSVYVADSLNNRVLIFDPPLVSGMAATRTLGANFRLPASIEFDLEGNTWVSDAVNNQLLRFNASGVVDRVLFKDVPTYTGQCGGPYVGDGPQFYFPGPGIYQDSFNVCDSRGSLGIDSDGNLFATGSTFVQDAWRFPAPFPAPVPGIAHSADAQLFKPYTIGQANAVTERSLGDPRGIATYGAQLIVADSHRILFWNGAPWCLTNGKAADGVVGASNFHEEPPPPMGQVRVDGEHRLWTIRGDTISVYTLPLVTGAVPFYTLRPPVPVRGGGSLGWGTYLDIASIAVTADGGYLWLADPENNRVIRMSAPLTSPEVDVVLGQLDLAGNQCNQGRGESEPSRDSLCYPGNVTFDRTGNLFVSDHALEVRGNHRLLEYDAGLFPSSPPSALFGVLASRVYGTGGSFTAPSCQDALCGPWEPAFDDNGRMVVGLNGYIGSRFPLVYQDPLVNPVPVGTLNDYYSMAYATHYDAYGNLYVTDRNRGRVLIYLSGSSPYFAWLPLVTRDG